MLPRFLSLESFPLALDKGYWDSSLGYPLFDSFSLESRLVDLIYESLLSSWTYAYEFFLVLLLLMGTESTALLSDPRIVFIFKLFYIVVYLGYSNF